MQCPWVNLACERPPAYTAAETKSSRQTARLARELHSISVQRQVLTQQAWG